MIPNDGGSGKWGFGPRPPKDVADLLAALRADPLDRVSAIALGQWVGRHPEAVVEAGPEHRAWPWFGAVIQASMNNVGGAPAGDPRWNRTRGVYRPVRLFGREAMLTRGHHAEGYEWLRATVGPSPFPMVIVHSPDTYLLTLDVLGVGTGRIVQIHVYGPVAGVPA